MRAQKTPAELIVGLDMADDAAVYLVARDLAIVETLDFFPPIVDDAYASGSIGAANAMSDVYAMGGEVLFALNIAAWPEDAPLAQLERVFQGAIDLASAIASMVTLSRAAAQAAVDAELHAATDITGFGLGGHAYEMAQQSSVAVRIRASLVPLLPGARGHAETGISFGGLERNRSYFDDETKVRFEEIEVVLRTLMLDPQTSGGLLVGVPPAHATARQRACDARGVPAIQIGEVVAGDVGVNVVS